MKPARMTRLGLAALFLLQLSWLETNVLSGGRFAHFPGGSWVAAAIAACVYGAGVFALLGTNASGRRSRYVESCAIAAAVFLTAAYYAPQIANWRRRQQTTAAVPNRDVRSIALLRNLVAAEEQYRLAHGVYSQSVDSMRRWISEPLDGRVDIAIHSSAGWSGRLTSPTSNCSVWVRDTTLRAESSQPEGVPVCGSNLRRGGEASIHSIVPHATAIPTSFGAAELAGGWLQHRGDPARTGVVAGGASAAHTWTTQVGGELRSPVAIAGNQVFVGAHGNGEFVALSLDKGALGYRLRTPNWMHHEPVVTRDLVIAAFGNNEPFGDNPTGGSPPSGVAAYDRRTGVERWRRATDGAIMTSPAIAGEAVLAVTEGREVVAWKADDGTELWRRKVPGYSAMANPLVVDSTIFVSLEPTFLCALHVRTSQLRYCRSLSTKPGAMGSGHVSSAWAGRVVLVAYAQRFDADNGRLTPSEWIRRIRDAVQGRTKEEMILVALEPITGAEIWRVSLGAGREDVIGHLAGTPVVAGGIAYVPVPMSGAIVAVDVDSGRTLWSTDVKVARGSVLVTRGAVLAATRTGSFVVLDARSGEVRCRTKLPATSDRAGPTLAGETAILTLRDGEILARPIDDWLACRV